MKLKTSKADTYRLGKIMKRHLKYQDVEWYVY